MPLNAGIIGLGNIGKIHYRIYKQIKGIGKIYLVDRSPEKTSLPDKIYSRDYRDILGKVDLVSIATPTPTHFEIASFFLKHRVPALVEKPLTSSVGEANSLINISRRRKVLLCAGHVERYNNAFLAIKRIIHRPRFIECHRLSPYPHRSLEISVVLDLMIHDLDIILELVRSTPERIDAQGVKILSSTEDIANARIVFKNGCVANITSSRISSKKERKLRIFTTNSYVSLDYAHQEVELYRKENKKILKKLLSIKKEEPLKKEITEFVDMVKNNHFSIQYCTKAREALKLAIKIQNLIKMKK